MRARATTRHALRLTRHALVMTGASIRSACTRCGYARVWEIQSLGARLGLLPLRGRGPLPAGQPDGGLVEPGGEALAGNALRRQAGGL